MDRKAVFGALGEDPRKRGVRNPTFGSETWKKLKKLCWHFKKVTQQWSQHIQKGPRKLVGSLVCRNAAFWNEIRIHPCVRSTHGGCNLPGLSALPWHAPRVVLNGKCDRYQHSANLPSFLSIKSMTVRLLVEWQPALACITNGRSRVIWLVLFTP